MPGMREQLRSNAVALISLVVAFSALGYNTWRNERTEQNRNMRAAGFELLTEIGSLQQVVFYAHYNPDDPRGDARMGWADVLVIRDLAALMPVQVGQDAAALHEAWQSGFEELGSSDDHHRRIDAAIDRLRQSTLAALGRLE